MAYNQFKKLEQLRKAFGIQEKKISWLPQVYENVPISQFLIQALLDAKNEGLASEKAKSEYIVTPVLKELKRNNPDKFSSFSGYEFEVDKKQGLTGFCDFILSAEPQKMEITAPIFCLVEAKKGEIEGGLAQCGAEMYAAQLYNAQEGLPTKVIYGCVTNAFSWCFLKLEDHILYIDPEYVSLNFTESQEVLAVLQWILNESL